MSDLVERLLERQRSLLRQLDIARATIAFQAHQIAVSGIKAPVMADNGQNNATYGTAYCCVNWPRCDCPTDAIPPETGTSGRFNDQQKLVTDGD